MTIIATGYSPSGVMTTASTTNQFQVIQDHIISNSIIETTASGSVSLTLKLISESDRQPVDNVTVLVDGILAVETIPGTFQATMSNWNPLYQFDITIERPGFSTQNITLSGYTIGNIAVEALVVAILLTFLILLARRLST